MFAVGCYTQHPVLDARGEGVSVVEWDELSDTCRVVDVARQVVNPSYLHWESSERLLYTVSEVDDRMGAAALFGVSAGGNLEFLGQQKGEGRSACHLTALPGLGLWTATSRV